MHVEITGDSEKAIQAELSSGEFQSAEQFIAATIQTWVKSKRFKSKGKTPQENAAEFEAHIAKQGIRPFSPDDPRPDFWPEEDSVDEFNAFIREIRHDRRLPGNLD